MDVSPQHVSDPKSVFARARRVAVLAALARAASATLSTAAATALTPYDAAGPLTHGSACDSGGSDTQVAPSTPLLALTAWDGAFFGAGARCGPAWHEQAGALAPLTSLAGRWLAAVATGVRPETAALAASWLAFVAAAVALDAAAGFYLPARGRRRNSVLSPRTLATVLFALGPASPFATALYAEAWHAAGLGVGLLAAAAGRRWASAFFLAAATAARSTGAAGAALFAASTPPPAHSHRHSRLWGASDRGARTALALTPLLAWQAHAWWAFCRDATPTRPAWCAHRPLPLSLPAVQAAYWGVGPGRYWTLRNAPNFALAVPALAIAAATAAGAGGLASPERGVPAWALRAHTAALALLVLSSAHVNVATRLLALGAPGWVFSCAAMVADGRLLPPRVLWAWVGGFVVLGGVLHATWYPWT